MKVLVSSCLLGKRCRYDGKVVSSPEVINLLSMSFDIVDVCPEVMGGLPVPRSPAEIVGGTGGDVWRFFARVLNINGKDVSDEYMMGSLYALSLAVKAGVPFAVLKSRSPACGVYQIYDGSFTNTLREGSGVFAFLLRANGIEVFDENDIKRVEIIRNRLFSP